MPRDSLSSHRTRRFKGLGRLRWYCTPCSKQCRDENAFKQHTLSEPHKRNIDAISSNFGQAIEQFSQQFQSAFLDLLRTSYHKSIQINRFYQTYIADHNHVHLNATRWHSLTDFARWLSREGLCLVEEKDDGIYIAWIDTSPDYVQRAAALSRNKKRQDAADQRQEERQLEEQVKRAHAHAHAEHHSSPLPTQPASSVAPTQHGDATVAFRLGTTASTSHHVQTKPPNIFKASARKRKRPVEESESGESPKINRRARDQ